MRRRRRHERRPHHDRWLVSYADFITLLFAFFVVMYSISQVNESKYRVLSNTLEDAFREIQEDMRSQYAITYSPTNPKKDGTFRKIELRT